MYTRRGHCKRSMARICLHREVPTMQPVSVTSIVIRTIPDCADIHSAVSGHLLRHTILLIYICLDDLRGQPSRKQAVLTALK